MTLTTEESHEELQATPAAHSVDLRKTYGSGQAAVEALADITVAFERAASPR